MLAREAAAVALKVAVLLPTGTVTEAGMLSEGLLPVNVTLPAALNEAEEEA